ncbi:MAG: hydrogenase maturation nickel metallochaperone HypA [Desulfuromonadales bacterium]|nr:hydrogenase maturation nickel metallochaperone HypA [Desulfuromonadales bacterium]
MHELSLTQSLIEIAVEHARREGARAITAVTLEIGALSGVIPEAVEFAFEACSKGTLAEGALLRIEAVDGLGYCRDCDREWPMTNLTDPCPQCGAFALEVRQGQEMTLIEMEIE